MNRRAYIIINGETLPIDENDYTIAYTDIETDRVTEDGKTKREIVREGKMAIQTNFTVTQPWLQKLRAYKAASLLNVVYYEPSTASTGMAEMWVTDYTPSLIGDNGITPLFKVSMTFQEY